MTSFGCGCCWPLVTGYRHCFFVSRIACVRFVYTVDRLFGTALIFAWVFASLEFSNVATCACVYTHEHAGLYCVSV